MSLINEINNIDCSPKALRKFGLTLGIFFAVVGAIALWRHHAPAPAFFAAAGFFLFFGQVWPVVLKPLQKCWMGLAVVMGAVMSRVVLCVLFYLVVTPIGLLTRCFGKDFLNVTWDRNKESYWIERPTEKSDSKHYENQF